MINVINAAADLILGGRNRRRFDVYQPDATKPA
jgi:hypothetical protein